MTDHYQTVIIHLSDGRKSQYFGKAQVTPEDEQAGIRVNGVTFGPVMELPKGCEFTDMQEVKHE